MLVCFIDEEKVTEENMIAIVKELYKNIVLAIDAIFLNVFDF